MEIRKVTQSDNFNDIALIYALSWKAAYRNIVPQQYLDELSEIRWSTLLQDSRWDSYAIVENGKYIGTSSICPARDEKMAGWGEIISIYLLPEYFGKGFGKPLLYNSVSALRSMGYNNIYLWVLEENIRGIKFYEKNGFALSSDRAQISIGGKDLTEVRYVLRNK